MPPIPPELLFSATSLAKNQVINEIVTVVGSALLEKAKVYWSKDHGSKVKMGAFHECPIEMFGDRACIVVDEEKGEVIFLTADFIQSYRYAGQKKRTVKLKQHTYFYYTITFKDGRESYVRMRRKYRDAMEQAMTEGSVSSGKEAEEDSL